MHVAALRLVVCLTVCCDLWLASSQKLPLDSINQSELARKAREIRQHRQVRQTRQLRQEQDKETKCKFKLALLDFPPYIMNQSINRGFMHETLTWLADMACFGRVATHSIACKMEPVFVQNQDEMVKLIKNRLVDFGFPILSDAKEKLTGLDNVTLIRASASSGCSMIVNLKQCEAESREQLFTSITSQWPILAFIILLSGISGVIIWLLEHRSNASQFSPLFTKGSPEGFWWAVESLTTVGYGDKTPKTLCGRAFGIMWILIGVITLSLFTATFTNAMQASLDGTGCREIGGKEVGVFIKNTDTKIVAKQYDAKIIEFSSLEEMQEKLSEGTIGRVLVDRKTASYFLDKSGLRKNRQIRMIRNIHYPMDYYLVHVYKGPVNVTNATDPEIVKRKKVVECGPALKKFSTILRGESLKASADLIPAELQTAALFDQMDGLFSSGSERTRFLLFSLLGIFLGLVIIGVFWEGLNSCNPAILKRKGIDRSIHHPGHFNRKKFVVENFQGFENRLKELSNDLQKIKKDFAKALLIQERDAPHETLLQ
ncbi:uncharacterized protein [Pocillopora verrucosa]|uniref:uncharacterized protein n=1 Tax=Pocillopora verrucosa TaxID=203993 RepID=UPI0033420425